MGKAPKATKKFIKNRLKPELERRKKAKKFTQQKTAKKGGAKGQGQAIAKGGNPRAPRSTRDNDPEEEEYDAGDFSEGSDDGEEGLGSDGDSDIEDDAVRGLYDEVEDAEGSENGSERDVLDDLFDLASLLNPPNNNNKIDSGSEAGTTAGGDDDDAASEPDLGMDLVKLKETDPKFYKYLQDNDKELLAFNRDDDDDDQDGEEGAAEEGDMMDEDEDDTAPKKLTKPAKQPKSKPTKPSRAVTTLTKAHLAAWEKLLVEAKSLKAAKRVLLALRAALAERDGDDSQGRRTAYRIDEPAVFNRLIVITLTRLPPVYSHHLSSPTPKKPSAHAPLPSAHPSWPRLHPLIKSHARLLLTLIAQLRNADTLHFALSKLPAHAPLVAAFPRSARQLAKTLLATWSAPATAVSADTRRTAYAAFRALAAANGLPRGKALRAMYLAYARSARVLTVRVAPAIEVMAECFVDAVAWDVAEAYQVGYGCLREIAGWVRAGVAAKEKDSHRRIYSWPFLLRLHLWSRVLSTYCTSSSPADTPLRLLVYPFIQLATGAVRINPGARFYPFRIHVVRLLAETASAVGVYVPLTAYLTDVLEALTKGGTLGKGSKVKGLEWKYAVKAGKQHLGARVYLDALVDEVSFTLLEVFTLVSRSIGFPEIALHPLVHMRRFMKAVGGFAPRWRKAVQAVVDKAELNAKWVEEKRSKVEFSPLEQNKVRAFLSDVSNAATPIGQHYEQALKVRLKLEAEMEEHARTEDEKDDDDDKGSSDCDYWPEQRPRKKTSKGAKGGKGGKGAKGGKAEVEVEEDDDDELLPKEERKGGKGNGKKTAVGSKPTEQAKAKAKRAPLSDASGQSSGEDIVGDVTSMDDLLGGPPRKKKKRSA
ncbi:Noc2-domain-containing protein [Gonapodya prolifera JEL478]|uniref:Noc2-domain-containing protein n=1 Tax=Gonapodya prolifera (strain JEL478) TaxID=1344416 RepID=A0A139AAS5_GONPJ|nr:Noc2-domain-containing protein [Gonapodya prolifera JEL478]|eukprot:KXS13774.1 Noc2-domain-containing protein [Gonapodya prolifera JEL478]